MQTRVLCCGAQAQLGEEQRVSLDSLPLCHIAWQDSQVATRRAPLGRHRQMLCAWRQQACRALGRDAAGRPSSACSARQSCAWTTPASRRHSRRRSSWPPGNPAARLFGSRRAWSCNLRLILGGRSRLANRQARICSLLARGHGPGSGSGRCALHGRRVHLTSGRALVRGCGSGL